MLPYDKSKFDRLKFQFEDAKKIKKNFSQSYQDMFVLTMLNGKKKGTFLDIGAHEPMFISNTYLLEKQFKWDGIAVDMEEAFVKGYKKYRKCSFVLGDALALDYPTLFAQKGFGSQIDYLSIDIEPKTQTLACLKKLPWDKYRFSVITYETDFYDNSEGRETSERVRKESREFLIGLGYELVVGNIANTGPNDIFEDWYVDPKMVDPKILAIMKYPGDFSDASEKYMLKP